LVGQLLAPLIELRIVKAHAELALDDSAHHVIAKLAATCDVQHIAVTRRSQSHDSMQGAPASFAQHLDAIRVLTH
jgi:hypothetical protein